jgi:hypothetical protein
MVFTMHYIYIHVVKIMYLEKSKYLIICNGESIVILSTHGGSLMSRKRHACKVVE